MATKRGRKSQNEMYFGPKEEEAVIKFLESNDDKERNLIFNQWLNDPLIKMIESIIRTYKLYRKGITFEELHTDTSSFLITKVHKFKKDKGKKAYSYFGTICKNYLLCHIIKDDKYMKQNISYEDISSDIEEREDLSYEIHHEPSNTDDFMLKLAENIKEEMNDEDLPPKKKLTPNEKKVGFALIEILQNWEVIFGQMENTLEVSDVIYSGETNEDNIDLEIEIITEEQKSKKVKPPKNTTAKYNKNAVLETMRNFTNLSTKDIRIAMKRYKTLYELLKYNGL